MNKILADSYPFNINCLGERGNYVIHIKNKYERKVYQYWNEYVCVARLTHNKKLASSLVSLNRCHLTVLACEFAQDFISTYSVPDYGYTLSVVGEDSYYYVEHLRPYNLEISNVKKPSVFYDKVKYNVIKYIYKERSLVIDYNWCLYGVETIIRIMPEIHYLIIYNKDFYDYVMGDISLLEILFSQIYIIFAYGEVITMKSGKIKHKPIAGSYKYHIAKYLSHNTHKSAFLKTKSAANRV